MPCLTRSPRPIGALRAALFPALLAAVLLTPSDAAGQSPLETVQSRGAEAVDFTRQILPLLQRNCVACHQAQDAAGGLVLDSHEGLLRGGDSGPAVVPKQPEASLVLLRASGREQPLMPPEDNDVEAKPLTAQQLELLQRWIQQGAAAGDAAPSNAIAWQGLAGPLQPIYAIATSADGRWAACGRGNAVSVYDLASATQVARLIDPDLPSDAGESAAHRDLVQSIAFSPDGRSIATGGFRTVKLWRRVEPLRPTVDTPLAVAAGRVAPSPDGARLALVNTLGDVEIWDRRKHQRLHTFRGQGARVVDLRWTVAGDQLFGADAQGRVTVWDPATGERRSVIDTDRALRRIRIADDGGWWAAIDGGQQVSLWRAVPTAGDAADAAKPDFEQVELPVVSDIDGATALAFLAGKKPRLAIATESGRASIIELPRGKVVATLQHGAPVTSLAASQDGASIATAGRDGKARCWAAADGKPTSICEGHPGQHLRLARAQRDAARSEAAVQRLTARLTELQQLATSEAEAKAKIQAEYDQAAQQLADSEAEQARTEKQAALQQQQQALKTAAQATRRAAAAVTAQTAAIQQARRRQTERQHRLTIAQQRADALQAAIVAVDFSADGGRLATAHADGQVRVYRVADGRALDALRAAAGPIGGVAFLDGQRLCAFGASTAATLWSLAPDWQLERCIGSAHDSPISDRVTALDFRPDGGSLAVGSGPPSRFGEVRILAAGSGQPLRDFGPLHGDSVLSVQFSPDGRTLACAAADTTIRLLDVASGDLLRVLEGHTHHVLALAWQDDGQTLASASADLSVKIWSPDTGQQQRTINGFLKEVTAVRFVGATSQIATACADGQLRLFDAADGKTIRTFGAGSDYLYALAVAADGQTLLAGGQDGVLRVWNLSDGKRLHEIE